jgi:hypothetical protein
MSEETVHFPPKTAKELLDEYVARNGKDLLEYKPPSEPTDVYYISVNYVCLRADGRTERLFNTRKVCASHNDMIHLKYILDSMISPSTMYRDIDKPRNLAKCVTVE